MCQAVCHAASWCAVCLCAHAVMRGEMLCARHAPGVQRVLCFLLTCHFRRQGAIGFVPTTVTIHELEFQPCVDRMKRAHACGICVITWIDGECVRQFVMPHRGVLCACVHVRSCMVRCCVQGMHRVCNVLCVSCLLATSRGKVP